MGISENIEKIYRFISHDVWNVEGDSRLDKVVKAGNLAVRGFFNKEIQERASALTYRTVLAIVPAMAMLFAIARGFGLQNLLHGQLMQYFPAQRKALETGISFVDSYLNHASEGVFVGVGLLLLIYTLISLMSSVEASFNKIWGIEHDRPFSRKVTDYTALFLFIPIFLICSAGLSIFLSSMVQRVFPVAVSPIALMLLDMLPIVLVWLTFTFAFWLIPHTRVHFRYALICGVIFGSLYSLVQWIFVEGQIMVSSYNAIYGSFAFLPLLLFWLQLSWMLVLMGTLMTYCLQNIYGFNYNHHDDLGNISQAYLDEITIMLLAVIAKRFQQEQPAVYKRDFTGDKYNIPIVLVDRVISRLRQAGLISTVIDEDGEEAYQPKFSTDRYTLGEVKKRLSQLGSSRFLTVADREFASAYSLIEQAPDSTIITQLLNIDKRKSNDTI